MNRPNTYPKATMEFKFDFHRTLESAAYLLSLEPNKRMSKQRLLALLYIADRESLVEIGRPITGGHLIAMECGPVTQEVYDLINAKIEEEPTSEPQ